MYQDQINLIPRLTNMTALISMSKFSNWETEILLKKLFFEDLRFFSGYGIVVKQSARHTPGFYIAFNNLWCQKARHLVITMTFGTCIGSLLDDNWDPGAGVEIWHSIATINGLISIFWVVYSLVRVLIGQLRIYSCILLSKYCSKVEGRSSIFASQRSEVLLGYLHY